MWNSADLGSDDPARSTQHLPTPPPLPANSLLPATTTHTKSSVDSTDSADLGSGDGGEPDDQPALTLRRPRFVWTIQLHKRFVDIVSHLGIKNAEPKTIMQLMNVDGLTRENVASHLQKYRLYVKRMQVGGGGGSADPATDSLFASSPGPDHFLHPGRPKSHHFLPFVPVILQQQQKMAAAAAVGMGGSYGGPSPSDLSSPSTISSEHESPLGRPTPLILGKRMRADDDFYMDSICEEIDLMNQFRGISSPAPDIMLPNSAEFLSLLDSHEDPQNFNRQGTVSDINSNSFNFMASSSSNSALLEEEYEKLSEQLKGLIMYFSLFPSVYEFRKDELIQMWMAEGFIEESQRERMEDIGSAYFNSLHNIGFLVSSRCDSRVDFDSVSSVPTYNPGNLLYKVNTVKLSELVNTTTAVDYYAAMDDTLDGALEMKQHLSLNCKDIDEMTFGTLKRCKHLRTLLLLSGCGSSMKYVPRDLFLSLKDLRTLNLSRTLISELPSSIRNAKSLRYLNLSNTPIKRLPESIDSLHHLQTIKLRGCVNFLQLPKGMKKLINLRHIDLDIIRQLWSMPPYLGNLTNLQTLSAFLVGREEGYRIGELKNLNDLRGVLRISRLENVSNKEEAEEAALIDKKCLQRLELRWSNVFIEKLEEQEKILECLQPHASLKELQIQHYAGSTLPTWISNPSFAELVVLTLYRCTNCQLLPSIGQLQMLKSLSIIEMNEVKEINHQFFRDRPVDQAFHAFPKLEILEVDIMFNLKEWKEIQVGDLPSLLKLTMDSCPELDSLPSLSWLKSLKHLEFRRCPKLLSLPSDGLPTLLESFIVIDCPELKEWCRKVEGEDWSKIYHVPSIWFDCEEVRSKSPCRPGASVEISEDNMELDGYISTLCSSPIHSTHT